MTSTTGPIGLRVMPVLDLSRGQAVHAVAGDRAHYAPVQTSLHPTSDPLGLARAFRDVLGLRSLYLADLDAIGGGPPALDLYQALNRLGLELWVDAGLRDEAQVLPLVDQGVTGLVAGSETLRGAEALFRIVDRAGPRRVVFSLDLKGDRPILAPDADWESREPTGLVRQAVGVGARRILFLDLARVGLGSGLPSRGVDSATFLRAGDVEVWIGGGVAGRDDLNLAERAGVSTILVGSALLDGRIVPGDLAGRS